uniref:protein-tyrosine-phosphatase n=1 Tax=Oryzias latipes TaxID=8090 RepID=A0A3P9IK67_ORYLA
VLRDQHHPAPHLFHLLPSGRKYRSIQARTTRLRNTYSGQLSPYMSDTLFNGQPLKLRCFEDINECINASTEKRKRVLVHCRDGFSLAPTCIIQYLMVKQNMRLIAAYELLRAKYPVNIKECHQNVLVSLERELRPGGNVDPEGFKQAISRKMAWT